VRQFTLLLLLCLPGAFAIPPLPGEDLTNPIAKGSKITYADLLRVFCTDLKVSGDDPAIATATTTAAFRSLGDPGEQESQEGKLQIEGVHALPMPGPAGRAILSFAMTAEGEQWYRYLALFDLSGPPKLLDTVLVPGFPDDGGDFSRTVSLGPGASAWIVDAFHSNSQQGYQMSAIVYVNQDRFDMMTQVGLFSCTGCGSGTFKESLTITAGLHQVSIRVRRTGAHPGIYSAIYRWDKAAGKYVTSSRELIALDDFNQKNY
jgi:hypothetical protein